jgi:hypothetical protein
MPGDNTWNQRTVALVPHCRSTVSQSSQLKEGQDLHRIARRSLGRTRFRHRVVERLETAGTGTLIRPRARLSPGPDVQLYEQEYSAKFGAVAPDADGPILISPGSSGNVIDEKGCLGFFLVFYLCRFDLWL